jgi:iron complex outermembrane receptor protein
VATGYGTPQISNLTVTPQGVSGNNSQLQSQTNVGYDLGADWTPVSTLKLSVTGFYEFFKNELVTQSPGAGLQSYTFNAPASQHRGIEAALDWRPYAGWRLTTAYTHLDGFFTSYIEQLSAGAFTSSFNRDGNKMPGVSPNELLARLGYDQPIGTWKGLGGFVQVQWKDAYFIDNANLLKAPAYELVNLNIHYNIDLTYDYFRSAVVYFEVRNVFDRTYVASANNISDSISATTGAENPGSVLATTGTGSIYAGEPRTFVGGVRLAFR